MDRKIQEDTSLGRGSNQFQLMHDVTLSHAGVERGPFGQSTTNFEKNRRTEKPQGGLLEGRKQE